MGHRPRPKGPVRFSFAIPGNPADPDGFHVAIYEWLRWLEVHNYAPSTILNRSWQMAKFVYWAHERGIVRPNEVTLPILETYQRHVTGRRKSDGMPLSHSSHQKAIIPLRLFFAWCTRSHRILYNPASELVLPKSDHPLPKATLDVEEVEALMAVPDLSSPYGLRDRAILEVLYATGMRRGELVGLDLADTDLPRRWLTLRHTKNRWDRVVPMGERAAAWVVSYLERARPEIAYGTDPGALFLAGNGERLGPKWLTGQVHHYIEAAGIGKSGSCHLLRHTAATLMLHGGADVRYVQELLGHRDLGSTHIYTRVSPDRLSAVHAMCHPGAKLPGPAGEADAVEGSHPGSHLQLLDSHPGSHDGSHPQLSGGG